ncbi:hypothetical protein, partial [Nocardia sp. NPDC004722]
PMPCAPTSALTGPLPATLKHLHPNLTRDLICLIGTPSDTLIHRFVTDILNRGIPINPSARAKLT